ncbi:MAG: DegT/DnrJ/EryC1/StrS aminotransferase family protein [Pelagibacteraceae bacterium]|nr:DegT/DnrJ/EryC1/StrS aminotransferase family protein [Pelagibacteraceae bacterium]
MISLVKDTIGNTDIDRLVEWLKTYPRLTKGSVTLEFEEKFSNWLGRKHSVFVNSGSSANLLVLSALQQGDYLRNNKIVVPSTAWATDLAPVIQLGLKPLLCDSNLKDLSVDLEHLEKIFIEESPSTLLLVSVLGLVPDMKRIVELCEQYEVILLEDTCESMGCEYIGQKLGTFGLASTFSTFFGHHISTIEGGIISTDDKDFYELLVSIRSHGWDRDLSKETQIKLQEEWGVSEFDAMYTFYYSGFNMRSTDLQAYIGLSQIDNLNDWGKQREDNYYLYQGLIETEWKPTSYFDSLTSNFAYPVISDHRDKIVKKLQENDVEVRPMICGSMGTQPLYVKHYKRLELPNVSIIDKDGFYVPNHPKLTADEIVFITNIINGELSK